MNHLPVDLLEKINSFLANNEQGKFSRVSFFARKAYLAHLNHLVDEFTGQTQEEQLALYLYVIYEQPEVGIAILKNEHCKKILINEKSDCLPHWLLGLAESNKELILYALNDEQYKNSLSKQEFDALINNNSYVSDFVTKNNITPPLSSSSEDNFSVINSNTIPQ